MSLDDVIMMMHLWKRKLTVLLLCSAATAKPKAMRSNTNTEAISSFEAMALQLKCSKLNYKI